MPVHVMLVDYPGGVIFRNFKTDPIILAIIAAKEKYSSWFQKVYISGTTASPTCLATIVNDALRNLERSVFIINAHDKLLAFQIVHFGLSFDQKQGLMQLGKAVGTNDSARRSMTSDCPHGFSPSLAGSYLGLSDFQHLYTMKEALHASVIQAQIDYVKNFSLGVSGLNSITNSWWPDGEVTIPDPAVHGDLDAVSLPPSHNFQRRQGLVLKRIPLAEVCERLLGEKSPHSKIFRSSLGRGANGIAGELTPYQCEHLEQLCARLCLGVRKPLPIFHNRKGPVSLYSPEGKYPMPLCRPLHSPWKAMVISFDSLQENFRTFVDEENIPHSDVIDGTTKKEKDRASAAVGRALLNSPVGKDMSNKDLCIGRTYHIAFGVMLQPEYRQYMTHLMVCVVYCGQVFSWLSNTTTWCWEHTKLAHMFPPVASVKVVYAYSVAWTVMQEHLKEGSTKSGYFLEIVERFGDQALDTCIPIGLLSEGAGERKGNEFKKSASRHDHKLYNQFTHYEVDECLMRLVSNRCLAPYMTGRSQAKRDIDKLCPPFLLNLAFCPGCNAKPHFNTLIEAMKQRIHAVAPSSICAHPGWEHIPAGSTCVQLIQRVDPDSWFVLCGCSGSKEHQDLTCEHRVSTQNAMGPEVNTPRDIHIEVFGVFDEDALMVGCPYSCYIEGRSKADGCVVPLLCEYLTVLRFDGTVSNDVRIMQHPDRSCHLCMNFKFVKCFKEGLVTLQYKTFDTVALWRESFVVCHGLACAAQSFLFLDDKRAPEEAIGIPTFRKAQQARIILHVHDACGNLCSNFVPSDASFVIINGEMAAHYPIKDSPGVMIADIRITGLVGSSCDIFVKLGDGHHVPVFTRSDNHLTPVDASCPCTLKIPISEPYPHAPNCLLSLGSSTSDTICGQPLQLHVMLRDYENCSVSMMMAKQCLTSMVSATLVHADGQDIHAESLVVVDSTIHLTFRPHLTGRWEVNITICGEQARQCVGVLQESHGFISVQMSADEKVQMMQSLQKYVKICRDKSERVKVQLKELVAMKYPCK